MKNVILKRLQMSKKSMHGIVVIIMMTIRIVLLELRTSRGAASWDTVGRDPAAPEHAKTPLEKRSTSLGRG